MSSQNEKNFFDPKTIIAVLLVGVLFFGWQKYLEYKYPDFYKNKDAQTQTKNETAASGAAAVATPSAETTGVAAPAQAAQASPPGTVLPETRLALQSGQMKFDVSSKGMGIRSLTLSNYNDREHKPIQLGISDQAGLFEIGLVGQTAPLDFQIEKVSETNVRGVARSGSVTVEHDLQFHPETSSWTSNVVVRGGTAGFPGLTVLLPEHKRTGLYSSFLMPSMEHQEFVVKHQGTIEHVNASSESEDVTKSFSQVSLVAISSQYFTSALIDQSTVIPEVNVSAPKQGELRAVLAYKPASGEQINLSWKTYSGPKSMEGLQSVDPALADVLNLGFFASIGKILLSVLKWFYGFVGNWGVSIILLTVLVRLLVLPFNIASYKSMKKMQKIQPMLQSIRERYKEDPAAMNRETMALMREQKVNPLGGCLPMLLQMPVFFALYQVLGQSIELYQAPFILWIHDLSVKDPFFVLPVLMGVTMFIQQKITPTTMDPQQAKILLWMPLIFSVFTLSLPAGLTLYIFVSTLFGVLQQQIFMRDTKPAVTAATAIAK